MLKYRRTATGYEFLRNGRILMIARKTRANPSNDLFRFYFDTNSNYRFESPQHSSVRIKFEADVIVLEGCNRYRLPYYAEESNSISIARGTSSGLNCQFDIAQ